MGKLNIGSKVKKVAVVFGCTGMTGSILSRMLVDRGYNVVGITRRSSTDNTYRLQLLNLYLPSEEYNDIEPNFQLMMGDITDMSSVINVLSGIMGKYGRIDNIFNFAAQSHVKVSFQQPQFTWHVNAEGCLNVLEACRNIYPKTKYYFAASSEMFGNNYSIKKLSSGTIIRCQNENTSFIPVSPYGISKVAGFHLTRHYRETYNLFACSSISFNHESFLRGDHFVTKKICRFISDLYIKWINNKLKTVNRKPTINQWSKLCQHIPCGLNDEDKLPLGNLKACRDWSWAPDICRGILLMMDQKEPQDFVFATGETHSIMEFLQESFKVIGLPHDEDYIMKFVRIDPKFYRPCDLEYLCGDSSKAQKELGWFSSVAFKNLVKKMVDAEINMKLEKCNKWEI